MKNQKIDWKNIVFEQEGLEKNKKMKEKELRDYIKFTLKQLLKQQQK